jgi:hypothetical protein
VIGQVPAQYALELLNRRGEIQPDVHPGGHRLQPACPSELILAIRGKMGVMPRNAYGLTEVSGAVTFTHPVHARRS